MGERGIITEWYIYNFSSGRKLITVTYQKFFSILIPSNYDYRMGLKNNLFRIKVFLNDKDKKPLPVIFREFMGLWWYKKNFPIHYIGRFMYRKGFNRPKDYMDMREYKSIVFPKRNNPQEYVTILNNKLIFQV